MPCFGGGGIEFDSNGGVSVSGVIRGVEVKVDFSFRRDGVGPNSGYTIRSSYRDVYKLCCSDDDKASLSKYRSPGSGSIFSNGATHTELPSVASLALENTSFDRPVVSGELR